MTIGSGIAIFGVWLVPCVALLAPHVGGPGVTLAIGAALYATFIIVTGGPA